MRFKGINLKVFFLLVSFFLLQAKAQDNNVPRKTIQVKLPMEKALTYTGRMAGHDGSENYEVYVTFYKKIVTVVVQLKKGGMENLKERRRLAENVLAEIAKIKNKHKDRSVTVRLKVKS